MPPAIDCDAILFDLDGVLVNSAARVEVVWEQWARMHGLDPRHVIEMAHGRRTIETVRLVAPHLAESDEVARLEATESVNTEGVLEVPGARELLESLPATSWAIVTSGIRAVATIRIRFTRLPPPKVLVCADEIEHGKPDPEGYLTAASRLGADPMQCVVIEDAPPGLEAARAAGMRSIGVCGTYSADALSMADVIVTNIQSLTARASKSTGRLVIEWNDSAR